MYPVDAHVGEEEEGQHAEEDARPAWGNGEVRGGEGGRGDGTALRPGGTREARRGPSRRGDAATGSDGVPWLGERASRARFLEPRLGKGPGSVGDGGVRRAGSRAPFRHQGRRAGGRLLMAAHRAPGAVTARREELEAGGSRPVFAGLVRGEPLSGDARARRPPWGDGERVPAWRGSAGGRLTVRGVLDVVVELAVAPHLGEEEGDGGHADPGEGAQRVEDLPAHLVLWGAAAGEKGGQGDSVPAARLPTALSRAARQTGRRMRTPSGGIRTGRRRGPAGTSGGRTGASTGVPDPGRGNPRYLRRPADRGGGSSGDRKADGSRECARAVRKAARLPGGMASRAASRARGGDCAPLLRGDLTAPLRNQQHRKDRDPPPRGGPEPLGCEARPRESGRLGPEKRRFRGDLGAACQYLKRLFSGDGDGL